MKINELRKLSDKELNDKIIETKRTLFDLRLKQSTGSLEKPSQIKNLRKEKGFDVSDRIQLTYTTDSSLVKEAIAEHEAYIKDQVLAVEIKESTASLFKQEELGDSNISFDVIKN